MSAQLRLSLERAPDHARAAFVVSDSNALAVQTLDSWPDWRGGALTLVGPLGSGKTHLAAIWAERVGAAAFPVDGVDMVGEGPVLVEDAEGRLPDETLFHLLNVSARPGGGLLLTSRVAPSLWPVRLPDLRSRLNALPTARIEEPDDTVLGAMLDKFFFERNIRPSAELLAYLVRRIERSAQSAQSVVARLDEAADATGRRVSRSLARLMLGEEQVEAVP
ncbi:chromosomal replication initiator DnaA [Caulobacter sp. S45]|uniref:chromosomal replication initiator DnaA n=1 Tax=Caulobacter sp. S45 TaxID=1641861 RepID=UPI0015772634|nr:chromosomal replication initiator DnaA [Caulobacter sp. S45]